MYKLREDLRSIAIEVIGEHKDLANVKPDAVVFLESEKQKRNNGKTIYADCSKVSDKYKALIGYDFIITIYGDAKNITPLALKTLLWHEMKHIGYKEETPYIVPHDLEDFKAIVDAYGTEWVSQ